jgi:multiple sugar transport system ATP-binding protein
MSVADNMGFALKIAGMPKAEIRERVAKAAEILDLTPFRGARLPLGDRQRVGGAAAAHTSV